ncbi:hypothetical protein [Curtobacterium flaccumfaciens]|uniref:hypothetical protein n=1 Tax=Curtobacterium flaccumfaciens TaxID=2035 RepID=UPI001BDDE765|nr:hypothetical protein [Curtobacterium flaccumfaciens]MBT1681818.1 hypothetical protein [Curtobacterium flaccumfaciens pv. flaccumfaciens]
MSHIDTVALRGHGYSIEVSRFDPTLAKSGGALQEQIVDPGDGVVDAAQLLEGDRRAGLPQNHKRGVRQVRTTAHGRAIGAAIGNRHPDPTSPPGILREAGVLLQHGDVETQIGVQSEPLAIFKRDRGFSRVLTTFSHEADAERYLLIKARPELVSEPWGAAPDRYTWPEGVDADDEASELTVTWRSDDGLHRVVTRAVGERRNVCMTAWVRNVRVEELLGRAVRVRH